MARGRLVTLLAPCSHIKGLRFPSSSCTSPLPLTWCSYDTKKYFGTSWELQAILIATGWIVPNHYDWIKENRESFQNGYVSVAFTYTDPCTEGTTRHIKPRMKSYSRTSPRKYDWCSKYQKTFQYVVLLEGDIKYRESFTANTNCTWKVTFYT